MNKGLALMLTYKSNFKKKGQEVFDEYRTPQPMLQYTERHELDYKLLSTLMSMLLTLLTERQAHCKTRRYL